MSDEVGGADVRDRVLSGGRASDGECAESYGRAAASPCGPSPAPAPSIASPPRGAVPSVSRAKCGAPDHPSLWLLLA